MVGGEQARVRPRRCRCSRRSARTSACAAPVGAGQVVKLDQPAAGRRPHLGHRRGGGVRRALRRRSAGRARPDRHVVRRLDDDDAQSAALHLARLQRRDAGRADPQGPGPDPRRSQGRRRAAAARRDWPSSASSKRGRAAWATRTWPRWSSCGKSPPASTSPKPRAERCRDSPRICPCSGRSWTSTTGSRPRPTAGFSRVEILFVHALDPRRIERLLREHCARAGAVRSRARRLGGRRARPAEPARAARTEFLRSIREAVETAARASARGG